MKNLIYDIGTSRCRLQESTEIKPSNGKALGVLKGICSDFSQATRNENFYSRALWERVLASDYYKEGIDTKTLYGALDHPENLENMASQAAICCTKLWIDDSENALMGTFDILPTDKGKTVKALCDYGSILGVSSRGVGDLYPMDDGSNNNRVEEDSYLFVCFDVVTQPAAIRARQSYQSLTESQKIKTDNLLDTITENIKNTKTQEDLDYLMKLVENIGVDTPDKIHELYESQSAYIKENKDLQNTEKYDIIIKKNETLQKDLEEAYKQIRTLSEQSNENNILVEMSYIKAGLSGVKGMLETNLNSVLSQYNEVLQENKELDKSNNNLSEQVKKLEESNKTLNSELSDVKQQVSKFENLNNQQQTTIGNLNEKLDYAVEFVGKCRKLTENLKAKQSELASTNSKLLKENSQVKTQLSNLKGELEKTNKISNNYKQKLTEVKQNGSYDNRLSENLKREYAHQKEMTLGISISDAAMQKVLNSTSLSDIDLIISEAYNVRSNRKVSTMPASIREASVMTSEDDSFEGNSVVEQAFNLFRGRK